jgi:hypothetical protein
MGWKSFGKQNGKYHFPFPKGNFLVGCEDVMTVKHELFLRFHYPIAKKLQSSDQVSPDLWTPWIPNLEYSIGYVLMVTTWFVNFIAKLFLWFLGNPYIPIDGSGPPILEPGNVTFIFLILRIWYFFLFFSL